MPFEFKRLEIPEVILVQPKAFGDDRGFFVETYKRSDFVNFGIEDNFVQDNHSRSIKNVLRGLHYQTNPKAQSKLVRCIEGEILDVAVDIRKSSPNYGKWVGEILSAENKRQLYVPVGFAHAFLVLSETAEVVYKTGEEYSPENDAGIRWNDPKINIKWNCSNPLVSEKDDKLPFLDDAKNNF
jgi:dTDP-4-dehydrorhamnose 3,5-epimerase